MQLEIANAQKSEFEESSKHLHDEIRDLQEERKIAEKKSAALNKDLKRQLQQEKMRNDRLQEKMKECFTEVQGEFYAGVLNQQDYIYFLKSMHNIFIIFRIKIFLLEYFQCLLPCQPATLTPTARPSPLGP